MWVFSLLVSSLPQINKIVNLSTQILFPFFYTLMKAFTEGDQTGIISQEHHTLGSQAGDRGPSGPRRPAPHPPPARPALIWHSTPTLHTCMCVCVCGPDWMTAMMTQSILWVACFFQGCRTPTPPVDRSEQEMLSGLAEASSLVERWSITALKASLQTDREGKRFLVFILFWHIFHQNWEWNCVFFNHLFVCLLGGRS